MLREKLSTDPIALGGFILALVVAYAGATWTLMFYLETSENRALNAQVELQKQELTDVSSQRATFEGDLKAQIENLEDNLRVCSERLAESDSQVQNLQSSNSAAQKTIKV